jgi:hypothetical protein
MTAFLSHARARWKALLALALLAAVIGALLPLWASLPINAALGWAFGCWPAGVKIGPLTLLRFDAPDLLTVAAWRMAATIKPGELHWFVGAYRVEADRHLLLKWWRARLIAEPVPMPWCTGRSWVLLTRWFDLQLGVARIGRPAEA